MSCSLTCCTRVQENFFRNFGVILTFAFAGTFISAVVLGYVASRVRLGFSF